MNNFIKLHVGLFQFIRREVKKLKTLKSYVKFFKSVSVAYCKEVVKLYKALFHYFDADYRKQKANYAKYQQYRKDITNAYKILQYMIKVGATRDARKYIKRDFEKHGIIPKDFEKELLKVIYEVKE